jgi:hypothetical protein
VDAGRFLEEKKEQVWTWRAGSRYLTPFLFSICYRRRFMPRAREREREALDPPGASEPAVKLLDMSYLS